MHPLHFTADRGPFLFRQLRQAAIRFHLLILLVFGDTARNRLPIGQHPTQPTACTKGHATIGRRFSDYFLSLALGSNKQDFAPIGHCFLEEITGFFQAVIAFGEIDNRYSLAVIKNEALRLRVPAFHLVSEMDTCFQQVGQFDIHNRFVKTPFGAGGN